MSEGWSTPEEARERARDAVARAFAAGPGSVPARRCPTCGLESATLAARCPGCSKRYDRRVPWLKDWMRWTLAVVAIAGLTVTGLALRPGIQETKQERATRLAREDAERMATQRVRLLREQRPVRGRARGLPVAGPGATDVERRAARRALVVAVEEAITADAQVRIRRRQMDGPVRFTECGPLVRSIEGVTDDEELGKRIGRYDCVAVKRDVRRFKRTVALFGHPYVATVDFKRGTYVFCKDNKVPGERGKVLVQVTLAPECLGLAAGAERIADGYIQPEE